MYNRKCGVNGMWNVYRKCGDVKSVKVIVNECGVSTKKGPESTKKQVWNCYNNTSKRLLLMCCHRSRCRCHHFHMPLLFLGHPNSQLKPVVACYCSADMCSLLSNGCPFSCNRN